MTKKLFILISFIVFSGTAFGQGIRDTVFNNVILIKSTDVSTNGFHFLVDIPIKPQNEPIIIFNDDFRIPSKTFFSRNSFLYGQNEFILITPDWKFRKEIIEEEKRTGLHIKAFPKNKIYHIKRSGYGYEVDSLSIVMHDPMKTIKINFKNLELKENEVKYYYSDCYELKSRHRFDDDQLALDSLNTLYNIYEGCYSTCAGKGSSNPFSCNFYTLSSLPFDKKLFVIKEMDEIHKINPEIRPKIFLPVTLR